MEKGMCSHARHTTSVNSPPNKIDICIVGTNRFSNEVLADILTSKFGFSCNFQRDIDITDTHHDRHPEKNLVFLLDCASMGSSTICDGQCRGKDFGKSNAMCICFNVSPEKPLEKSALCKGIRGIIHYNQPITHFEKAVHTVLSGELWFSRNIMEQRFLEPSPPPAPHKIEGTVLTRREIEILTLLSWGMSNMDIANKLFISQHTVKTHIYNLFKKIDVPNRFKATQWLTSNQHTLPCPSSGAIHPIRD